MKIVISRHSKNEYFVKNASEWVSKGTTWKGGEEKTEQIKTETTPLHFTPGDDATPECLWQRGPRRRQKKKKMVKQHSLEEGKSTIDYRSLRFT